MTISVEKIEALAKAIPDNWALAEFLGMTEAEILVVQTLHAAAANAKSRGMACSFRGDGVLQKGGVYDNSKGYWKLLSENFFVEERRPAKGLEPLPDGIAPDADGNVTLIFITDKLVERLDQHLRAKSGLVCGKCKGTFQPWSPEVARKFKRGHIPLCGDCWHIVYKNLPAPVGGKAGFVEERTRSAVPTKGTKKYVCAECKHEQFEPWIMQDRAARMKCPGCGSLQYAPKTREAQDDIAGKRKFVQDFGDVKGSDGGESFVRG